MSYNEKFKTIYLFERAVNALATTETEGFNLDKNSRTVFVTNFGFVEGDVILNSGDDSDLSPEDGKIEMLHRVLKETVTKVEDSFESKTEKSNAIPLKNVTISAFSGDVSNLGYFLLFADQVVGLTVD